MSLRVVAAGLLVSVFVVPATTVDVAADEAVFRFQDVRIDESSGLVDLDSMMVTTNDSGDVARVFVIDPGTGATVGLTSFAAPTVDVEALAPAGPQEVWVGDIGDNTRSRADVVVYRVPVAARQIDVNPPASFRLVYPDGPHDAESLFAGPDGRLHVISKSPAGGTVYRAPAQLNAGAPNPLEPVARVGDFATDAALTEDGRHVVVRSFAQASVYAFPGFIRVGTLTLPQQRQGEGISVGPGNRLRVSSEGAGSTVEQVDLPADLLAQVQPETVLPPAAGSQPSRAPLPARDVPEPAEDDPNWLLWSIPAVIALGATGIGLGLRRRTQ